MQGANWGIAQVEAWPDTHSPDDPSATRALFDPIAAGVKGSLS
jgi:hypothetical protein